MWQAVARPLPDPIRAVFAASCAESAAAGETPDAALREGGISLSRHKRTICRLAAVSPFSRGLDAGQVADMARRVQSPDLRRFFGICAEHGLEVRFTF